MVYHKNMRSIVSFFRHLFVPHEENNFQAKALQTDFLTFYLIFALVLTFSFKKLNLSNVLGFATDITVEKLYQLTNQEREKYNLPKLKYNQTLAEAARIKAQDMFNKDYWAHYSPDGLSPWNFILQAGYRYQYAGENLAKNFLFSQDVVKAWMNSPTHRDNILKKEYTDIGFAVVNGILNGEETTLVVQMFGQPLENTGRLATQTTNQEKPKVVNKKPLLDSQINQPKVLASSQKFVLNINYLFIGFLMIALIFDLYFSVKLNIIRIKGKTLAHLIFIIFLIFGLTVFVKGTIL